MAVQKTKSGEPVVAVLLTREQNLEELKRRERIQHEHRLENLQRAYQQDLERLQRLHAGYVDRVGRALAGEHVPGICATCGQDYNTFHHQVKEGKCPKCGAELGAED